MSRIYTLDEVVRMEIKSYPLSKKHREFLGAVPLDETVSMQVTGAPGSGKSSYLLQVADEFARFGLVLYNTAEERVKAGGIKFRALMQKIKHKNRIRVVENTDLDELRNLANGEYVMVIVDSIQKMKRDGKRLRSSEVMSIMSEYPERPMFYIFVSQTTKDRTTAAGEASDAHDVDIEVFTEGEHDEPRYARIDKSRLNPSVLTYHIFTPKTRSASRQTNAGSSVWGQLQAAEREKRKKLTTKAGYEGILV